jgi:hypothetical protein
MPLIRPAPDARAGDWLLEAGVWWWHLVRYGPPGFETYVRIAFGEDDGPDEDPTLRTALATLASYTSTADDAYAAVWEGWTSGTRAPAAPRVEIDQRPMLLFSGPIEVLRDAPCLAWYGAAEGFAEPHLVWPADQAWCLACDVDEEIEFSVGCSPDAATALAQALPGAVRHVRYGEQAPMHRNGPC